jgi:hypothetical protein
MASIFAQAWGVYGYVRLPQGLVRMDREQDDAWRVV